MEGGEDKLELVFFRTQPWLEKSLPVGDVVTVSGKIEGGSRGGVKKILHPTIWGRKKELDEIARVWPLYPLTAGVSHVQMAQAVDGAFQAAKLPKGEWLDKEFTAKHNLPDFKTALDTVHHPVTEADIQPTSPARVRLAADEIFTHQLALIHARQTARLTPGMAHGNSSSLRQKMRENLPFPLTSDQDKVIEEIDADLSAPLPMLRLVQGDVGSGKTLVALMSILRVVENGSQAVMMAPTEILAQQHFESAKKLLEPLGITVALLVGSVPAVQKKRLKQHIAEGFCNVVIGTHALVQEDVAFDKLGLAVIDEQHRFGVQTRLKLLSHTSNGKAPDILVLTATPIPRTLALTFYGDMDVSVIREKPPGRTPVQTQVLPQNKGKDVALSLFHILDKGEQAYWVCPLVEENEESDLNLTAVTKRYERLQALFQKEGRNAGDIAILHGKMKPAEKEAVMADFKAGKTRILVATTVIEVGVDVPQATVMVIEHAERFGLSQLHQLRGRVGRGSLASHCILLYQSPLSEAGKERLAAMRQSEDGFYLAEKDLELRGPGEVLGTRQSGAEVTHLADLTQHRDLIPLMRDLAETKLRSQLSHTERQALVYVLELFGKGNAAELLKAG